MRFGVVWAQACVVVWGLCVREGSRAKATYCSASVITTGVEHCPESCAPTSTDLHSHLR